MKLKHPNVHLGKKVLSGILAALMLFSGMDLSVVSVFANDTSQVQAMSTEESDGEQTSQEDVTESETESQVESKTESKVEDDEQSDGVTSQSDNGAESSVVSEVVSQQAPAETNDVPAFLNDQNESTTKYTVRGEITFSDGSFGGYTRPTKDQLKSLISFTYDQQAGTKGVIAPQWNNTAGNNYLQLTDIQNGYQYELTNATVFDVGDDFGIQNSGESFSIVVANIDGYTLELPEKTFLDSSSATTFVMGKTTAQLKTKQVDIMVHNNGVPNGTNLSYKIELYPTEDKVGQPIVINQSFVVGTASMASFEAPIGFYYEVTQNDSEQVAYTISKYTNGTVLQTAQVTPIFYNSGTIKPTFSVNWRDNYNFDRYRPEQSRYQLTLYARYQVNGKDVYLAADNLGFNLDMTPAIIEQGAFWDYTFPALPTIAEVNDQVYEIDYVVKAPNIGYYLTEYENADGEEIFNYVSNGGTIVNTLERDFRVSLNWRDGGQTSLRPSVKDLDITLYRYTDSLESAEKYTAEYNIEPTDTGFSIAMLPAYDANGKLYVYYAVVNDIILDAQERYESSYTNIGNFGGVDRGVFNGGIVSLTLNGTIDFEATKVWLDDGSEEAIVEREKTNATLRLWRYPNKSGASWKEAAPVTNDSGTIKGVIPAINDGEEKNVFSMEDIFGNKLKGLPKYDEDGYEYIYFMKESLDDNNYKSIFVGTQDPVLYNGNVLHNVRTGTLTYVGIKEFAAAAEQDACSNITVTLQLQQMVDGDWIDVAGQTRELNGFSEEITSKTEEFRVDKYDEMGLEIVYRVVETAIYYQDTLLEITETTDEEGNVIARTYLMDGHRYAITDETLTMEEHEQEGTKITNRLIGETTLDITKKWQPEAPTDSWEIEVQVYRDGEVYQEPLQLSGQGEEENWQLTGYPRYNKNGREYEYTVLETAIVGYTTTYGYRTEEFPNGNNTRYATLVNHLGGLGKSIQVSKKWLDDGDTMHRKPITVQLYRYTDASKTNAVLVDGATTQLNADNGWRNSIGLDNQAEYGDYFVKEYYIDDANAKFDGYAIYDDITSLQGYVQTVEHLYYITNEPLAEDGSAWQITNLRAGFIEFPVTKTWVDGNTSAADRPNITLTLTANGTVISALTSADLNKEFENLWRGAFVNQTNGGLVFPKCDDKGALITYTIAETMEEQGEYQLSRTTSYAVGDRHFVADVRTTAFRNALSKRIDFTAYKQWWDLYNHNARSDIYFQLYQKSVGDTAGKWVNYGYVDQRWSFTEGAEVTRGQLKMQVTDLPKYDSKGYLIQYGVHETMNVRGEYQTYYYNSYNNLVDNNVPNDEQYTLNGGTVVNILQASRIITGNKLWANIRSNMQDDIINAAENVVVSLYRRVMTENGLVEDIAFNQAAPTTRLHLVSSTSGNQYTYEFTQYLGHSLPKYSPQGTLYEYYVGESMMDMPEATELYTTTINSFVMINNFITTGDNEAQITVHKTWQGVDNGIKPTRVTFELYRRISVEDGETPNAYQHIATKYISGNGENQTIVFNNEDGVLKYAPSGHAFEYKVVEVATSGYTISSNFNHVLGSASVELGQVLDGNPSIEYTNTYTPGEVTLSGKKVWVDYDNAYDTRQDIILTLTRKADGISGTTTIGSYTVTAAENWNYVISTYPNSDVKLERYATNGNPYTYTVTENVPAGYDATNRTQSITDPIAPSASINNMKDITNTLSGRVGIEKTWVDGNNQYHLRPTAITVVLQRAVQGTDGWSNFNWPGETTAEKTLHTSGDAATKVTVSGNKWTWNYTGRLPTKINNVSYQYRLVERKIGGALVDETNGYQAGSYQGSATQVTTSNNGNTFTSSMTNTLRPASILVSKVWVGDSGNQYDTRPAQVVFTLQRRLAAQTPEADWVSVQNNNNNNVTVTLSVSNAQSGNASIWSASFTDLPICDETGVYYEYRAVETTPNYSAGSGQNPCYTADGAHQWDQINHEGSSTWTNTMVEADTSTVTATKKWLSGGANLSVTFELRKGYTSFATPQRKTVTAADNWTVSWAHLPKYDKNGTPIEYRVHELYLADLNNNFITPSSQVPDQNGNVTLTNILKTTAVFTKTWNNVEKYGTLPNITIQLQSQKAGETVWSNVSGNAYQQQLTPTTGYHYTFSDLPAYDDAGKIQYRVVETKIGNIEIQNDHAAGFDITAAHTESAPAGYSRTVFTSAYTNTYQVVSITGSKTWIETGNQTAYRPNSITLTVEKMQHDNWVTVPSNQYFLNWKGWTYTISNLPRLDEQGNDIAYRVKETAVPLYTAANTTATGTKATAINGNTPYINADFENTLNVTYLQIDKVFGEQQDNGNAEKPRVTFTIAGNGKSYTVQTGTDGSFSLDEHGCYIDVNGKEFVLAAGNYTLTEKAVEGGGYVLSSAITNIQLTIAHTKDAPKIVSTDKETNLFVNNPLRGNLVLTKLDDKYQVDADGNLVEKGNDDGEKLDGAVFDLCLDEDGTQVIATLVKNGDHVGEYILPNQTGNSTNALGISYLYQGKLLYGDYYVIERSAPNGYELDSTPIAITINSATTAAVQDVFNRLISHEFKITKQYETVSANDLTGNMEQADEDHRFTFRVTRKNISTPVFAFTKTVTTNQDGVADFGVLPIGTYTVEELDTPSAYRVPSLFDITISEDGVTYQNNILPDATLQVENELKRGSITGTKRLDDTVTIAGALIGLYSDASCSNDTKVFETTTKADGTYLFEDIAYGTYYVKEIKAPKNYGLSDTVQMITISAQNQTSIAGDILDPMIVAQLSLSKVDDETNVGLSGATFTLAGTTFLETAWSQNQVSDADGLLRFEDIPVGTYTLTEQKLANYEEPQSFKVVVSSVETGNTNIAEVAVYDIEEQLVSATNGSYVIENVRIRRSFSFVKRGTNDETDLTVSGYLAGATFGLYQTSDCTDDTPMLAVSTADGKVTFQNLAVGTYYIKEIEAPQNYTVDDTIYPITVTEQGEIESSLTEVVNEVKRGSFALQKVDEEDVAQGIMGATYGIYKTVEGKLQLVMQQTTDEQGMLCFENLLPDTVYTVVEMSSPNGYLSAAQSISFQLELVQNEWITTLLEDGNGVGIWLQDGMLQWREAPTRVSIQKVDEENQPLAGASFVLTNAQGDVVERFISEEHAYMLTGVLVAGAEYTLTEVEAPKGYVLAEPITFVVEDYQAEYLEKYTQSIVVINEKVVVPPTDSNHGKTPSTGDNSTALAWFLFAVASMLGIRCAVIVRRKK